jgi:hypothetical protein
VSILRLLLSYLFFIPQVVEKIFFASYHAYNICDAVGAQVKVLFSRSNRTRQGPTDAFQAASAVNRSNLLTHVAYPFNRINRSASVFPPVLFRKYKVNLPPRTQLKDLNHIVYAFPAAAEGVASTTEVGFMLATAVSSERMYVVDILGTPDFCQLCSDQDQRPVRHIDDSECPLGQAIVDKFVALQAHRLSGAAPDAARLDGGSAGQGKEAQKASAIIKKAVFVCKGRGCSHYLSTVTGINKHMRDANRHAGESLEPYPAAEKKEGTRGRRKKQKGKSKVQQVAGRWYCPYLVQGLPCGDSNALPGWLRRTTYTKHALKYHKNEDPLLGVVAGKTGGGGVEVGMQGDAEAGGGGVAVGVQGNAEAGGGGVEVGVQGDAAEVGGGGVEVGVQGYAEAGGGGVEIAGLNVHAAMVIDETEGEVEGGGADGHFLADDVDAMDEDSDGDNGGGRGGWGNSDSDYEDTGDQPVPLALRVRSRRPRGNNRLVAGEMAADGSESTLKGPGVRVLVQAHQERWRQKALPRRKRQTTHALATLSSYEDSQSDQPVRSLIDRSKVNLRAVTSSSLRQYARQERDVVAGVVCALGTGTAEPAPSSELSQEEWQGRYDRRQQLVVNYAEGLHWKRAEFSKDQRPPSKLNPKRRQHCCVRLHTLDDQGAGEPCAWVPFSLGGGFDFFLSLPAHKYLRADLSNQRQDGCWAFVANTKVEEKEGTGGKNKNKRKGGAGKGSDGGGSGKDKHKKRKTASNKAPPRALRSRGPG